MITVIVACLAIAAASWFFLRSNPAYGLSFNWTQSDWTGGSSTSSYPMHSNPDDRTNWSKYSSKETYVNTGASTTLSSTSTLIEQGAVLPQAKKDLAACYDETDDKFYTFGGYYTDANDDPVYSSTTVQYNPATESIATSSIGNLPVEMRAHDCARVDSTAIYLLGGYNNSSSTFNDVVYKFDPSNPGNQVENTGYSINQGRKDAPVVYHPVNGNIYMFGGYYLDANKDPVYSDVITEFDPSDGSVSTSSLPVELRGASAAYNPNNEKIYVFGGYDNTAGSFSKEIYEFDPAAGTTTDVGDLPDSQGREWSATAYYSDLVEKFYIIGGYYLDGSNNPVYMNTVVSFSTSSGAQTETETVFDSGGLARASAAYSSEHKAVYTFGGYNGSSHSDKILANPLVRTLTSSAYNTTDPGATIESIQWTENTPDINFQIRTASNDNGGTTGTRNDDSPATWSSWCGPDDGSSGCSTTTYFTNETGTKTDAMFRDASDDHWVQYKAYLTRDSLTSSPNLKDVTISYDANTEPKLASTTASQDSTGSVNVDYAISDEEDSTATTSLLYDLGVTVSDNPLATTSTTVNVNDPNNVLSLMTSTTTYTLQIDKEQINCTTKGTSSFSGCTRGANNTAFYKVSHAQGSTVWLKGNHVTGDGSTAISSATSTESMSWEAKQDIDGIYSNNAKVRVNANDQNEAWQVGYDDSATYELDTKNPTSSVDSLAEWQNTSSWNVSWSGGDVGVGIDTYDLQYKKNTSGWVNCLTGTTTTSITFPDQCNNATSVASGDDFYYRSVATDLRSNTETATTVDATTSVDITPPNCDASSLTSTSDYFYEASSTQGYYNNATSGSYTLDMNVSDAHSGVQKVNFPDTTSVGGEVTASPYEWGYDWATSTTYSNTAAVTCTDNVGNSTTSSFTITLDTEAPTASIDYPDGTVQETSIDITVDGTDDKSGVDPDSSITERRSATSTLGECETWNSWGDVSSDLSGTYPDYSDNTVNGGYCYQYRYLVEDYVSNQATAYKTDDSTTTVDVEGPTGGSITYKDGWSTTSTSTITLDDGTDTSEISTSTRIIKKRTANLSDGTCGNYGDWETTASLENVDYPNHTATLNSDKCYQFKYQVSDKWGYSTTYESSNVIKVDYVPPSGLTSLGVTDVSSSTVSLVWQEVSDARFGNYEVWYGTSSTKVEEQNATQWTTSDKSITETTIENLNNNTTYYFKIWAVDYYDQSSTVEITSAETEKVNFMDVNNLEFEDVELKHE